MLEYPPSVQEVPGSGPQHRLNQAWHTPVILARKRGRQETGSYAWLYIRVNSRPALSGLKKKRNEPQSKGRVVGVSDSPDAEKGLRAACELSNSRADKAGKSRWLRRMPPLRGPPPAFYFLCASRSSSPSQLQLPFQNTQLYSVCQLQPKGETDVLQKQRKDNWGRLPKPCLSSLRLCKRVPMHATTVSGRALGVGRAGVRG